MRLILIAFLLWNSAFAQSYVATWTGTANSFEVQRSSDNKNFKTVSTPITNTYSTYYGATYYWRIKLNTSSGVKYSNTVWVYAMTTITNARLRYSGSNAIVSWRAYTEANLSYYTIESINNITTVSKHGGSYSITVPKIGVTYMIVAHYKNGEFYTLKVFNQ